MKIKDHRLFKENTILWRSRNCKFVATSTAVRSAADYKHEETESEVPVGAVELQTEFKVPPYVWNGPDESV
jgi:hypothetical protein